MRYGAQQMRAVLRSYLQSFDQTFVNNGGVTCPFFYESDFALVFPPCSDTSGTGMETLSEVLAQATLYMNPRLNQPFIRLLA